MRPPVYFQLPHWLAVACLVWAFGVSAEPPLSLPEAEQRAIERDSLALSLRAEASAKYHEATASGALPDPVLMVGVANLPADDFRLDEDPMTQLQVGVRQRIPLGATRRLSRARMEALAGADEAAVEARERVTRREVREAWLELYFSREALAVLEDNRGAFRELADTTEREFATGRVPRQDVLRAELELDRLEDRISAMQAAEASARARLARWVGHDVAARPLGETWPRLSEPPGETDLAEHPVLRAEQQRVQADRHGVDIARQARRPEFGVEARYGYRQTEMADGSTASDMLTVMATVDMPLFPSRRQGPQHEASMQRLEAATARRNNSYRELLAQWEHLQAQHQRLEERLARFDQRLVPQAVDNAEAAVSAYRSATVDFTALMRARITELDTRIDALRIRLQRDQTRAGLLYLSGEPS